MVTVTLLSSLLFSSALSCVISSLPVVPISLLCYRYLPCWRTSTGAPLMLTALALLFSNSYGGMVTHYGGAAGPVIFGVGYNDIKSWWLVGAVLTILTFLVHITLGVWWWNMLIGWNML
ncbi:anion permease [Escherichia coli]|nr:anion permease [Escherichia coli]MDT9446630.1 anion permease [Escherichia coli]